MHFAQKGITWPKHSGNLFFQLEQFRFLNLKYEILFKSKILFNQLENIISRKSQFIWEEEELYLDLNLNNQTFNFERKIFHLKEEVKIPIDYKLEFQQIE